MALGGLVLVSLILYLKGMMFQLSGLCYSLFPLISTGRSETILVAGSWPATADFKCKTGGFGLFESVVRIEFFFWGGYGII